ncbi:MAG: EamA family transporter RarD [Fusobacteriaceae bacterium]
MKEKMENNQKGIVYSLGAFIIWGLFPLYWVNLKGVPALEIVTHRIIWSFIFLFIFIGVSGRKKEFLDVFKNKKMMLYIFLAATFNCGNWLSYIFVVNSGRVLEASLGYFINPLLLILAGRFIFNEKLNSFQKSAITLAALGVIYITVTYQKLPIYSLIIAGTFTGYSITKKKIQLDSVIALTIETLIYFPVAILYLVSLGGGAGAVGELNTKIFLAGAGIVTVIPLFLFSTGAKLAKLSSIGFFQYLTPTIVLILGVFVFGEEFTTTHGVTFSLIWSGLMVYTYSILRKPPKIKS